MAMNRISNRYVRILMAGGAAVVVGALGVTAALAATATWTVQPGGAVQLTTSRITISDPTTHTVIICTSATASGTLESGSGLAGINVGSLLPVSFKDCTGPGGDHVWGVVQVDLPWQVSLFAYDPATGIARGTINGIDIGTSRGTTSKGCFATINGKNITARDGLERFRYTDGTGELTMVTTDSNLRWYEYRGCGSLINTNDPATITANFTVSPKQAITSP